MKIACLGWGSLIWNPGKLLINGNWHKDGPYLPIEYCRQSQNGRLTLVIYPGATSVPTLWAWMQTQKLKDAFESLREREGTVPAGIGTLRVTDKIGEDPIQQAIHNWMQDHAADAVIWTALKPRFNGVTGVAPTATDALRYLDSLNGIMRSEAENYIRKTPVQVATAYRKLFESSLGWTPEGL